jgi:hypothetical protein
VLAITAGLGDMQAVLTQVWDSVLPAMGSAPLPPHPVTQSTLNARLAGLHLDPPTGETNAKLAASVSGRQLHFAPNTWNVSAAQLDFAADSATVTLRIGPRNYSIACGLGAWQFSKSALFNHKPEYLAASGVWSAPDTFQITLRYYETPFCWTITCQYSEEGASLQAIVNVSFGPTEKPLIVGYFSQQQ